MGHKSILKALMVKLKEDECEPIWKQTLVVLELKKKIIMKCYSGAKDADEDANTVESNGEGMLGINTYQCYCIWSTLQFQGHVGRLLSLLAVL